MPLKTLIEFGLSEKEAKMYLALLELETAGANEIAKAADINRSSAYVVIESLAKKGLINTYTDEQKVQQFTASEPEVFLRMIDENERKQKQVKEKIKQIIPNLRSKHKDTKHRPLVQIYKGKEAIRLGFYDIFYEQVEKGMKMLRIYEDVSDILKFPDSNYIEWDVSEMKKFNVDYRIISPDNKQAREVVDRYKKLGYDHFVLVPQNVFNRNRGDCLAFSIYEDKIEFFSQDSFLTILESKEVADTLKNVFDMAWEHARARSKSN
ncbi:MAG TPA: helix-turn-helix domain-containing protein [Candidatus Nanoarchaeia archaeon]|nr:helix-turn-helix domain-containing protein [Candidatus Nanoarchaeia archaeon]